MKESKAMMSSEPDLIDEQERLRILRSYQILDTPAEAELDALTRLAARVCGVPTALLALADERRYWFKSKFGATEEERRREAVCDSIFISPAPLVIPDLSADPRFQEHPLVTGEPNLRFYAGVPLVSPQGAMIGTFCVLDHEPGSWTREQMEDLAALADQAMAQLELRRQRAEFANLMQHQTRHLVEAQRIAQVGSWELDADRNHLTWTPECFRIFGVSPEDFAATFEAFFERVHPDDQPFLLERRQEMMAGGAVFEIEHRIVRPDGEVRHVRQRGEWMPSPDGNRRYLAGTVQDITAELQATKERQELLERERAARTSAETAEARFRTAFDNMLAGIAIADDTGRLVDVNARYCEMLGYTREELLQKSVSSITAPEDWERNRELLQQLRNGEITYFRLEKKYRRKDGHWMPVRLSASLMPDDSTEHSDEPKPKQIAAWVVDITEERRALEQLQRNQWLMRIAGQTARVGGWAFEVEKQELIWSDEVRAIHEAPADYTPTMPEGIAMFAPEWQPVIKLAVQDCAQHGVPYDIEAEKITFTGKRIWVRTIGQAERDAAGRIVRIQGAFQDITEVRAMRSEAERMAGKLRTTLESISDAFFTLDRDWRFIYVNGEAQRLMEQSAEQLLGKCIWERFPEAVGSESDTYYSLAMREAVPVSFQQYYPPLKRWFDVKAYPSSEGLAVYFQDITERHLHQQQLEEAWARTRRVLETSLDVIAMLDASGRFVEINSRCRPMWGYTEAELTGQFAADLVHPEDRTAVVAAWSSGHTLASGTMFQCRSLRKDGSLLHVQWSSVWSEADQLHFIVVRDITEQIIAEERTRQSQRLEAVGQLTGGVAHDFNNLLTVVLGSSELLVEQLAGAERQRNLAELIRTAALRGAELTRGLLAFARRQALEPRTLAVPDLLDGLERLLARSLGENIQLKTICLPGTWPVTADPGQLEAALLNLCLNARDAMPSGGHLLIETDNIVLDELYASQNAEVTPGAYVAITVSDTGTGMPPEVLARAFDPFFTTKQRDKGTGLGLSMVYGFAKQSGGHVKIYSEPGHGTTVRLYVPRATEDAVESDLPGFSTPLRGHERILLVEDDELVREFAAEQLASLGYQVTAASTPAEALDIVRKGARFDLLFTDVVMPGMNGPQLAQEILQLLPDLPVLYTSGYTENAIVHQGRVDAGVNLLHKPYRRQALAEKVRQMLATRPPKTPKA